VGVGVGVGVGAGVGVGVRVGVGVGVKCRCGLSAAEVGSCASAGGESGKHGRRSTMRRTPFRKGDLLVEYLRGGVVGSNLIG